MNSESNFQWWMRRRCRVNRFGYTGRFSVFAALSLLASVSATAGPLEECYRDAENRLEVRPCLEASLVETKTQLAEAEQMRREQLMEFASVTGRDAALSAFDEAAKDFRTFRESVCRLARLEAEPGTGANDFERDCLIRMTRAWIREIRSHSSLK